MFYTLIKHGFFDQSERAQGPIYILNIYKLDLVKLYTPQMLVALTPALLGRDNMGNYCPVVQCCIRDRMFSYLTLFVLTAGNENQLTDLRKLSENVFRYPLPQVSVVFLFTAQMM